MSKLTKDTEKQQETVKETMEENKSEVKQVVKRGRKRVLSDEERKEHIKANGRKYYKPRTGEKRDKYLEYMKKYNAEYNKKPEVKKKAQEYYKENRAAIVEKSRKRRQDRREKRNKKLQENETVPTETLDNKTAEVEETTEKAVAGTVLTVEISDDDDKILLIEETPELINVIEFEKTPENIAMLEKMGLLWNDNIDSTKYKFKPARMDNDEGVLIIRYE